jgi:translocation and assembly module TamA
MKILSLLASFLSVSPSGIIQNLREDRTLIKRISASLVLLVLLATTALSAERVKIVVNGLEGPPLENVRAALRLPEGMVKPDGEIDKGMLDQFRKGIPDQVQEALQPYGFFNSRTEVFVQTSTEGTVLRVVVEPGIPVTISSVKVTIEGPGTYETQLQELVRSFPLKKGDVLLSDVYEKAKADLQSRARNSGYLDADFPVHKIDVYRTKGIAEIELSLQTGNRYYFGDVTFLGAPKYPDSFLRRYLSFKKGDAFSYLNLNKTRLNLYNSDRFREVFFQTDKKTAKNQDIPVVINLAPSPEKRIKTGVGYGTDTGARFLVRYQDVNIIDRGHEFRSELNVSERLYGLAGAYIVPTGKDFRSFTALRLSFLRETPVTYESNSVSLELNRERGFGENSQGGMFIRLLDERFTIGGETTSSFLVLPGVRLYGQRVDNLIRPQKGYRYAIELRGTDTFLGSTVGLFQVVSVGDLLFSLPGRLTLLLRSQTGFTLQRQAFDEVPVTLRFFAGGDRSVRGYSYQSLGPRDANGDVIGGKHLLFGSVELERAIGNDWGIAAFYDAGNAFDVFTNITFAQSAGLGIHYYSKVGPFRLDIARQVNTPSPATRIHFIVGIFI